MLAFLIEGAARVIKFKKRYPNPYYLEISKDYAQLNELISDIKSSPSAPRYYDEFIYADAPRSRKYINFTDYYSARLTPASVPLSEAKEIVWTFGGSTMQNLETTDEMTIANTLAEEFNRALGPTHVKNFGTGSFYSSYELIKFQKLLREVPEPELPSIVIFYDGYNDANHSYQFGAGNMQRDLSLKLQALVERKNSVLAAYTISDWLSRHSRFWRKTGARFVQYGLFPPAISQGNDHNLEAAIRIYTSNVKMVKAICELFQIKCFFILQPLIVTKTPLTSLEQEVIHHMEQHPNFGPEGTLFIQKFYEGVRNLLGQDSQFIDASHILNNRTKSDFYDLGHTGVKTPPFIGKRIAEKVLNRINNLEPDE